MDINSKKSSVTSSLYMSANETEMDDMSNADSKLLKNSGSKQETIDEEFKEEREEVATLRAGEAGQAAESDKEDEEAEEGEPLLDPASPVPPPRRRAQSRDSAVLDEEEPMLETTGIEQMQIEEPPRRANIDLAALGIGAGIILGGVLLLLAFIATLVLLPQCFHSLYYDEYALARNTWTGSVDDTTVYGPGWHIMAPWKEWIKFYKTVHTVNLNNLDIYSTDHLKLRASFLIYYSLTKNQIGKLYRNHGSEYHEVIYKVCKNEVLNQAQTFSLDDFRKNRPAIKESIKEKLAEKLRNVYGLELFNFFINELVFDREINKIYLKNTLEAIYREKALYDKNTALAEMETERLVKEYKNLARVVSVGATLNGTYGVVKPSQTDYDRVMELALSESLTSNYQSLGMDNDQIKMSYCWMNSLVYNPKVKFYQPSTNSETNTKQGVFDSNSIIVQL